MSVMESSGGDLPVLTIQDPSAAEGMVVFDCRPPLLPVSMDISGVDLSSGRRRAVWKCFPASVARRSVGGGTQMN